MTEPSTPPSTPLVCSDCHKDLESCAGCERPDCPNVVCFGCMTIELAVSHPHPHDHGG